jgi:hypothetical protein
MTNLLVRKPTPPLNAVRAAGLAHAWLDQGWATLNTEGSVLNADEHFCRWLDRSKDEIAGRPLWQLLKDYCTGWEALVRQAVMENTETFLKITLEKEIVGNHTVQVFQLECARHESGSVVRLSSMLPAVSELEEAAWDDHLSSDLARREMFVRLFELKRS